MNVGYFSVQQGLGRNFIDYEMLDKMEAEHETEFFRHIKFDRLLNIKMDGKKGIAVIKIS
jgi:hypothetical protein